MDLLRQLALVAVLTGAPSVGAEKATPANGHPPNPAPPPERQDAAAQRNPSLQNNPPPQPRAPARQPQPPTAAPAGPLTRIKTKPLSADANIPLPQDI